MITHGKFIRKDDPTDQSVTYGYKVPEPGQEYDAFTQLVAEHDDWHMMERGALNIANCVVIEPGDWAVLCSDGMYTLITDDVVTELFAVEVQ